MPNRGVANEEARKEKKNKPWLSKGGTNHPSQITPPSMVAQMTRTVPHLEEAWQLSRPW